ncbi:helix-turn-helix domain-containing protein [Paraburkholderia sp.]|uniref:helix-turn-helix transcriptional regulator n=1 Tax=Paraburkholderia sp. TaxID=1926495 RepID=UPI0039E4AC2B
MVNRVQLLRHHPAPPLDRFVDCFWWTRRDARHEHWEHALPCGRPQLVFTLSEQRIVCLPDQAYEPLVWTGSLLHGPQSRYYMNGPKPCGAVAGVSFRTGGVGPVLGVRAAELADCHVSLDALWGHRARLLHEQLMEAPDPRTIFRILEQRLGEHLRIALSMHPAVEHALMHGSNSQALELAVETRARGDYGGYSPRHFIALFREAIGMTPSHYLRIQRLSGSLRMLAQQPRPALADVAAQMGYYDQPHFTRECRALGGITPSRYRALDPDSPLHHVVANTPAARR